MLEVFHAPSSSHNKEEKIADKRYRRYGKELKEILSALRDAEIEINEGVLRLEAGWLRWTTQLDSLKRMRHVMDEDHMQLFVELMHVLAGKLEMVTAMLRRVVRGLDRGPKPSDIRLIPRRLPYAFRKKSIDKAVEELEAWQKVSDPSWFLILRMSDHRIDSELAADSFAVSTSIPSSVTIRDALNGVPKKRLALPPDELMKMSIAKIHLCGSRLASRRVSTGVTRFILDRIECPASVDYQVVKRDARDLAARLQHDEPQSFGLLPCKGFLTEKVTENFETRILFTMVFKVPGEFSRVRSLRDYLLSTTTPNSLSNKFEMARELARSIGYVHTFGFVHRNIRPETILTFDAIGRKIPATFLAGFESFRKEEGRTLRRGDDAWERNLYRHPSRQGLSLQHNYIMQHDIYSLGVCLLEVGLWQSFVEHGQPGTQPRPSALLKTPKDASKQQLLTHTQRNLQGVLLSLARDQLPRVMGSKYAEIVETCLTCLEPDNVDFGDQREFEDEDGIRVGVRYIEKVSVT